MGNDGPVTFSLLLLLLLHCHVALFVVEVDIVDGVVH